MSQQNTKLIDLDFDSIKVSTRTFTASTNMVMDIAKVSAALPIFKYTPPPKKRGRGKNAQPDPDVDIPKGSIVSVNYMGNIRGTTFKPSKKNKRWFRNSFSVIIYLDKFVNFKVCKNGTFQITGALRVDHAADCIRSIWEAIKDQPYMSLSRGSTLECLIIPAMRNLDFTLGIKINREAFDRYIHKSTDNYHCLLETSFGYTGLNVKKKITRPITQLKVLKITVDPNNRTDVDRQWKGSVTTYSEYLDLLPEKMKAAKLKHTRYNTFLVFHSGKIIQSGLSADFMRDDYYEFCDIINNAHEHGQIQEVLRPLGQA